MSTILAQLGYLLASDKWSNTLEHMGYFSNKLIDGCLTMNVDIYSVEVKVILIFKIKNKTS